MEGNLPQMLLEPLPMNIPYVFHISKTRHQALVLDNLSSREEKSIPTVCSTTLVVEALPTSNIREVEIDLKQIKMIALLEYLYMLMRR